MGELPRDHEIITYCQSGQRSYNAARILAQHGFRVRNLTGAYRTW
ncbi:MAG: rhodanese-like domain-containing protein [Terrimicrobiaceae bacterium]